MLRPFAADDAALQIVARQIDDRDGGFDGVLGGRSLDGFGDVVLRAVGRRLARFGVEPLEQVGGVVPRVGFHVLDEQLLRLFARQAGDALELALLIGDEPLVFRRGVERGLLALLDRALARGQLLLEPLGAGLAIGERRVAPREGLFERGRLLAVLPRLALGLHEDFVRLLLGFEERFLLARFGVAFGVLGDAEGLLFGAADGFGGDALAVGHPHGKHRGGRHEADGEVDEEPES